MESNFVSKAVIGAIGMAIGAALVTALRVAAVESAEQARLKHLADVASGRTPAPRVVVRNALECPAVGGAETTRVQ